LEIGLISRQVYSYFRFFFLLKLTTLHCTFLARSSCTFFFLSKRKKWDFFDATHNDSAPKRGMKKYVIVIYPLHEYYIPTKRTPLTILILYTCDSYLFFVSVAIYHNINNVTDDIEVSVDIVNGFSVLFDCYSLTLAHVYRYTICMI